MAEVIQALTESHRPYRSGHNCRCGWEGDNFTLHVIDVLCAVWPFHYVTFADDMWDKPSWVIEHSMECRFGGTLGTCVYNEVADHLAHDPDWRPMGRHRFVDEGEAGISIESVWG